MTSQGTVLAAVDEMGLGTFQGPDGEDLYMTGPVGFFVSGLLMSVHRWNALGITVFRKYDPESSPPQLVSRVVEYD